MKINNDADTQKNAYDKLYLLFDHYLFIHPITPCLIAISLSNPFHFV